MEKKETNLEHYKDEIFADNCSWGCCVRSIRTSKGCGNLSCEECCKATIEWLLQEYQPPIKMTLFEKSILECAVNHGYVWIARNEDFVLGVFKKEPAKDGEVWLSFDDVNWLRLFSDKFQFIKWEDEAVHIPTLLENCEVIDNE